MQETLVGEGRSATKEGSYPFKCALLRQLPLSLLNSGSEGENMCFGVCQPRQRELGLHSNSHKLVIEAFWGSVSSLALVPRRLHK